MSNTPKRQRTGLGSQAFFKDTPPPQREAPPASVVEEREMVEEHAPQAQAQGANEKVRTTVKLYPTTLALLDMLKAQARRQRREGRAATYSDILDEAIRDLAQRRGLNI